MCNTKKIAFFPYKSHGVSYIYSMQMILNKHYSVVDYNDVKKELIPLSNISCIYINWKEDSLDEVDESLLQNARKNGIKIIWVFHNRLPHDAIDENQARKRMSFLANICSYIIVHSTKSIEYLKDLGENLDKKALFIPHLDFIGDYGNCGKFNIDKSKFVYGIVGLIRPYKNIELLIDAFKKINKPDTYLVIVGKAFSEKYLDSLREKIRHETNIILCDSFISDLEMGTILDSLDVMVLPYNKKSGMNSGAMIMSFSYGKTVIISDIAMAEDYEEKYLYKYTYESDEGHEAQLMKALLHAYTDGKEIVKEKGNDLLKIVKERNSKALVEKDLINLIEG